MAIDYIAQHSYYLTKAVFQMGGVEFSGQSYLEVAYPEIVKKDTRTAEEIKQDVLKRLSK